MDECRTGYSSNWVEVDGSDLHYIEAGSGRPLFFIHGVGSNCHAFELQMDAFKDKFRCISVDIPGHNASRDRPLYYRIDHISDIMWQLMEKAGVTDKKPIIFGHSYGGAIAQQLVLDHQEQIEAAIFSHTTGNIRRGVVSGIVSAGAPVGYPFAWSMRTRGIMGHLINVHPNCRSDRAKKISQDAVNTDVYPILEMSRSMWHFRSDRRLHEIEIPILILAGTIDNVFPYSHAEYLHKLCKTSVLKIVRRAGHQSHIENPEMVNNYLERFLYYWY